jgi:hypothetical protein
LVIAEFGEVLTTLWTKDRQSNDSVANHDSTIFNKHAIINAHQEALLQDEANVRVKLVEPTIDIAALPFVSIVEGYLLRVRQ